MSYLSKYLMSRKATPQSAPLPDAKQARNSAGGYVFELDEWARLERWLLLGSEGGTYYASERELTLENAECVLRCVAADGKRLVETVVAVSLEGRAPKNDPAIFALALALKKGDLDTRRLAADSVSKVCRTGTHLFQLVEAIDCLKGWGRLTRRAVAGWYTRQTPDQLAVSLLKYQQRNGWSTRDVLALSHAGTQAPTAAHDAMYRYVVAHGDLSERKVARFKAGTRELGEAVTYPALPRADLPALFDGVEKAKAATSSKEVAKLIAEYGLPRECVPTEHLNSVEVWDALLHAGRHGMPIMALVRNLGKMTSVGLLQPLSDASKVVATRLQDEAALKHGRVHPLALLMAARQYARGHGDKGKLAWSPVSTVTAALDASFSLAFRAVVPTNLRWLLALDVSGSMDGGSIAGSSLTPREAAAAMALVTMNSEAHHHLVGFTSGAAGEHRIGSGRSMHGHLSASLLPLALTPRMSVRDACAYTASLPMGGTDCALPMLYAKARKLDVDVFVVFTDNETWAGGVHPIEALKDYRQSSGRAAKLIVVGMTATQFTIADPNDAGSLDVVGFDVAAPQVMSAFALAGRQRVSGDVVNPT
jgi:60 kDa SS-A/Ro ribonucleoprotein